MSKRLVASVVALPLVLSACAGGGGGGGSAPAVTSPPPPPATTLTPTPGAPLTPTPTPGPTPEPTPTPTPISTPLNNPSGALSFGLQFNPGLTNTGEDSGQIVYNSSSGTYTFGYMEGGSGGISRSIDYRASDQAADSGNYLVYARGDPNVSGRTDILKLFKVGSANTAISLTYTTYGINTVSDGANFSQYSYFVLGDFDQVNKNIPVTGTATYNGVVAGLYNASSLGHKYEMSGTSALAADFANSTVTLSINFIGKDLVSSNPDLAAQAFSGPGAITRPASNNAHVPSINGQFTDPGANTLFRGNFFGPNAEEVGLNFKYDAPTVQFAGVAVGKR